MSSKELKIISFILTSWFNCILFTFLAVTRHSIHVRAQATFWFHWRVSVAAWASPKVSAIAFIGFHTSCLGCPAIPLRIWSQMQLFECITFVKLLLNKLILQLAEDSCERNIEIWCWSSRFIKGKTVFLSTKTCYNYSMNWFQEFF